MPTSADPFREQLLQLWNANFLNVKRATQESRQQARTRLDVAVELIDIALVGTGEFQPGARECLTYLSCSRNFVLHLWTIASPEKVRMITATRLDPAQIVFKGHNENPNRRHVDWDPRKPWFDILIDRTSGFDPVAGHWMWFHHLLTIATESLSSTMSGGSIIHSSDRFNVAPDASLVRRSRV